MDSPEIRREADAAAEIDSLRSSLAAVDAWNVELKAALIAMMEAAGCLRGNPASDNEAESMARRALRASPAHDDRREENRHE